MPYRHKQEYPPLLDKGFHRKSFQELQGLCVDAFPLSKRRTAIMAGFKILYDAITRTGIPGEIWIDGSFVTQKIDPDDVDAILWFDGPTYDKADRSAQHIIDQIASNTKQMTMCHSFALADYPQGHPGHKHTKRDKARWQRDWGQSYTTKEPKGIAVLLVGSLE